MQVPDGRHNHFLLAPSLNIDRKQKEDLADQSEEGTGAAEAEAGQGTIVRPLMNGGERVRLTDGRARAEGRRGKRAFDWWTKRRTGLIHYQ